MYKDVDGVSDTLGWFIINRQNESSREDQYMSDGVSYESINPVLSFIMKR